MTQHMNNTTPEPQVVTPEEMVTTQPVNSVVHSTAPPSSVFLPPPAYENITRNLQGENTSSSSVLLQPTTTANQSANDSSPVLSAPTTMSAMPRGSPSSARGVSFSSQFSSFSHHNSAPVPTVSTPVASKTRSTNNETLPSPPKSLPRQVYYQPDNGSPSTYGPDASASSGRRISSDPPGRHYVPGPSSSQAPVIDAPSVDSANPLPASSPASKIRSPRTPTTSTSSNHTTTTSTPAPSTPVSILKRNSAFTHDRSRTFTPAECRADVAS